MSDDDGVEEWLQKSSAKTTLVYVRFTATPCTRPLVSTMQTG